MTPTDPTREDSSSMPDQQADAMPMRALAPLAMAIMLSITGLGIMIPLLPFYARALGASDLLATLIYSTFSLMSFVAAPLWGKVSDRIGRKPVMAASLCFTMLSYLWLAHAGALWELYGARALGGASAGLMVGSLAMVADVTPPARRAGGMGLMGAAFAMGFMCGPLLGAWLVGGGEPNFAQAAMASMAVNGLALLAILLLAREPDRRAQRTGGGGMRALLGNRTLARMVALFFCVSALFTGIEGGFALWGAAKFGLGPREVGQVLFLVGGVSVIAHGGAGAGARRLGERRAVLASLLMLLAAFALMPLATAFWQVLAAAGVFAAAVGLHNPTAQGLISRRTPAAHQGHIMGITQGASNLARVFGPAWAGLTLNGLPPDTLFYVGGGLMLPVLAFAAVTLRAADRKNPGARAGAVEP